MKRVHRFCMTTVCALACLLGAAHSHRLMPVYAQQPGPIYDDGTFYITGYVDVDSNYYLSTESYMEVVYDTYEDIDTIEVDSSGDQDGGYIGGAAGYGDDYDPADVSLISSAPVPTGHNYGVESEGYACFDDGEGDCDDEYVGAAYASIDVPSPPPQISSLNPSSVNQGDQGTLTVIGTNLVQGAGDQLTANLTTTGNVSINCTPFTPSGTPSSGLATFAYDFTGCQTGTWNFTVTNDEGKSSGNDFRVNPQPPPTPPPPPVDPCAVSSNSKTQYSAFVPTGMVGGSGTIIVSFGGSAYSAVSQTISYGPYSTPSSIAANIAALITANYTKSGLTARAFGPNVIYSGKNTIGAVNHAITGSSVTTSTSSTSEAGAEMACEAAPPAPPPVCGNVNSTYVLTVVNDSVVWKDNQLNYGRYVTYSLEYAPTKPNTLGAPATFQSTITEHLSVPMAYGFGTPGTISGEFDDVLGNTGAYQSGTYTTDRCFTVTSATLGNLGHVMSYDLAGRHVADHIQITQSKKTSILNNWTNPDGSPKDISIP